MNRWVLVALAGCVLSVACDDDNVTAPSAAPSVFSAILIPANEVPAIGSANAEGGGRGAVQVQLDVARGTGGAVTSATATFYFQLTDFPAGTTVIGAHIHPGAPGVNGPVIVSTGITATANVPLGSGTGDFRVSGIPVDPALAESIINNPGAYYFNVHSPTNPGGFSRGQLSRVQ